MPKNISRKNEKLLKAYLAKRAQELKSGDRIKPTTNGGGKNVHGQTYQ